MSRLLARLNPEQRHAVEVTEGPLLVLAGAGTGKTRVITYRIAHLLEKGAGPDAILAVTFTNKAAAEMRERIAGLVGAAVAKELTVGTFHAFCLRVLRRHADLLGLPRNFTICDASDQLTAVRGALRELHVPEASLRPADLHARISLLKNRLVAPEEFLDGAADDQEQLVGRAYRLYEQHLARARTLDFDDLLVRTVRLLREGGPVLEALRARFRWLLVDEFQDTNRPQFEIVRAIAGRRRNLCVVGDDDQSIYGWRGADVSQILDFERHFPGAVVVRLETNYRSTEEIVGAANAVIGNNPARHDKQLRSHAGTGEPVAIVVHEDEEQEAQSVVFDIVGKVQRGKLAHGDVAILLRTAPQARAFETALRAHAVPYVLVGGMSFFDRKEVRDLLAFVKLMVNPADEVSFLRVVNTPPRGVGKGSLDRLIEFATRAGVSVPQALAQVDESAGVPAAALTAMRGLLSTLAQLGDGATGREIVPRLRRLLTAVDYDAELARCYPDAETREARSAAVAEFLNVAENYARRSTAATLGGFLEEVALAVSDERPGNDDERRGDAVTLMTLHAAKGLEFPHVYLVGMEEGLLPHLKAVKDDGVEEERRLAYVGITRAQKRLTVSYAASRARFGRRAPTMPSRFLFEMQGELPPEGWVPAGAPHEHGAPAAAPPPPRGATTSSGVPVPPPRPPAPPRAPGSGPRPRGGARGGARKAARGGARRGGPPVPPGLRDAMRRKRER